MLDCFPRHCHWFYFVRRLDLVLKRYENVDFLLLFPFLPSPLFSCSPPPVLAGSLPGGNTRQVLSLHPRVAVSLSPPPSELRPSCFHMPSALPVQRLVRSWEAAVNEAAQPSLSVPLLTGAGPTRPPGSARGALCSTGRAFLAGVLCSCACAQHVLAEGSETPLPRFLSPWAALLVLVSCPTNPGCLGVLNPQLGAGRPLGSEWLPPSCTAAWNPPPQAVRSHPGGWPTSASFPPWTTLLCCLFPVSGNCCLLYIYLVFYLFKPTR